MNAARSAVTAMWRRVGSWVLLAWFVSFVGQRVLLFRRVYEAAKQRQSDDFYMQSVCANDHIKVNMGYHSATCDAADEGARVSPTQRALEAVFRITYLCGDVSCLEILGKMQVVVVGVSVVAFLVLRNAPRRTVLPRMRAIEDR